MAIHPSEIHVSFDPSGCSEIAEQLDAAYRSAQTIAPFAQARGLTWQDAYTVQTTWNSIRSARGERRIGRKIGFTNSALRRTIGAQATAYGMLFESMRQSDDGEVAIGTLHAPRVEVELAFVIGKELAGPDCTIERVLSATDYIGPALEIIDSRVESNGPLRPAPHDIIADNMSCAGLVLGPFNEAAKVMHLERLPALLSCNGVIEDSGVSTMVGGHPAAGIASLVAHLANRGEGLERGEIVLTGSFTAPLPVQAGDRIDADYGPWGRVSIAFR